MTPQNSPPRPPIHGQQPPVHLGLAGQMAQSFIHSPLSPLLFIAMLFMGIMGLIITPRQEDPQISVPMADIFVQYPGATAEQVASLAIEPLQRVMSEIPDVEHVYAASERGRGMVTVRFKVGEQLEKSIFKVHDKLQSNLDKIPPGVSQPIVKAKGIDDVPVVTLTLWSETVDDRTLRTLAFDVLQGLKEVPSTGPGFVVGGRPEEVRVEVMPERLSSFQVTLDQIANTIHTANSETQAGSIETGNNHFTVYTGSFLRKAEDIAELVVGTFNGRPVYIRDVANVFQNERGGNGNAQSQVESLAQLQEGVKQIATFYTGKAYGEEDKHHEKDGESQAAKLSASAAPSVTIAIAKKIGTNGVAVAAAVLEKITEMKGNIIPADVHVEITRNYGKSANDKVNNLVKKLFIATGAVTLLVLFSLGLRPAVVVTLVIPVVILLTVFSAWLLGFTIDRVSLFALIFSIGILVDDAIVVIENIYRRWLLKGEIDTETAVDAVREVGNPTILATFTVVAALLPMGFVSGMMGPYMMPIPALGSVAMIFSLFAAFVFTPWWAMRLKPSLKQLHESEIKEHRTNERLESFFRRLLTPLIENKTKGWLFFAALVVGFFLALSMFFFKIVEVKMLPLDNKPEFNVFVDLPEGAALTETTNLVHQFAEILRAIPEVTALQTYVGTSQPFDFNGMVRHYYLRDKPWQADIHVQLLDKKHRHRTSHDIALEARRLVRELNEKQTRKASITVVEMPPGPPVLQSIVAEVYGPSDKIRREVAGKLTEFFQQAKIIDDVDNYMAQPYNTLQFQVDTEKAVRKGVSVDAINRNLTMALGGYQLGDVKQGTVLEPTYIVMQVPLNVRAEITHLYDLPIPTTNGKTIPLAELGEFINVPQDPIIYHKDLRRMEYVVGDPVGIYDKDANKYSLSAPIYGMLEVEELLQSYTTPDNVTLTSYWMEAPPNSLQSAFEWSGEWTVTYETFRDMGLAFGVALILIYILVVWLFGNFIVPAVIMAPIPLTLLGIIPGHWLLQVITGNPTYFTATSMIGWIALAGIIVRNSILLVDYSIHEVQKGTQLQDAVILACKTRTRPIMITALALVAGSFVIIFDPIFQGMAISLLFGVMVSTLLTLVVIPLGCISVGPHALCAGSGFSPPPLAGKSSTAETSSQTSGGAWRETLMNVLSTVYYLVRMLLIALWMGVTTLWKKATQKPAPPNPPSPVGGGGSVPPHSPPAASQTSPPAPVKPPVLFTAEEVKTVLAPAETQPVATTQQPQPRVEMVTLLQEEALPDEQTEEVDKKTAKPASTKTASGKTRGIRLKPLSSSKDSNPPE